MREIQLRWFKYAQQIPTNAMVIKCDYETGSRKKEQRKTKKDLERHFEKKHGVLGANGRLGTKPRAMTFQNSSSRLHLMK